MLFLVPAGPHVGRGAARLAGGLVDAFHHQADVGVVQVHVAQRREAERLHEPALRVVDLAAQVWAHDRAFAAVAEGVGQRRVGDRHLQRRGQQIALADGQVHVVAHAPRPPIGDAAAAPVPPALARELFGGHLGAPGGRGHQARDLAGQVDPRLLADAELLCLLLDHRPVAVGQLARFEEVGVRGHLQRFHQRHRPVVGLARVAERLRGDVDALPAAQAHRGVDHARFQRAHGRDRLERRAGRIGAVDGPVGERRGRFFARSRHVGFALERRVFAFGQRFGELVRVKARRGPDRQHFAVARVQRHERAGHGRFAAPASVFHAFQQRLFALPLEREVERHLEAVAGERLRGGQAARDRVAGRVDLHPLRPGSAAQVAVVVVLDPFLAHHRPLLDATERAQLELRLGDLTHIAEHLRGHRTVGIVADGHRLLGDARKFALALGEHGQHALAGVGLDRHRGIRQGGASLDHQRLDSLRAHSQQGAQMPVQREPRRPRRRQRRGHDLHRVGRAARDDRLPFAVEDLAPRRRDRQIPRAVRVGLLHVLFAGQHLQVPQAEEDDREHGHRQPAQHRHPQRQLRRDGHARLARVDRLERGHARASARRARPPRPAPARAPKQKPACAHTPRWGLARIAVMRASEGSGRPSCRRGGGGGADPPAGRLRGCAAPPPTSAARPPRLRSPPARSGAAAPG